MRKPGSLDLFDSLPGYCLIAFALRTPHVSRRRQKQKSRASTRARLRISEIYSKLLYRIRSFSSCIISTKRAEF